MYACYDFNDEWFLIEMVIPEESAKIDFINFVVPNENLKPDNWQVAYNEQYLNETGTALICEPFDMPSPSVSPTRAAFFIFKNCGETLKTPYGTYPLAAQTLPDRLKQIIQFGEDD